MNKDRVIVILIAAMVAALSLFIASTAIESRDWYSKEYPVVWEARNHIVVEIDERDDRYNIVHFCDLSKKEVIVVKLINGNKVAYIK